MITTQNENVGKTRHRMTASDSITAREVLSFAVQSIEPGDRSQRQLFKELMPDLYVLRMKGFCFGQLTTLLNNCGFMIKISTVRTYYHEALASKMTLCEARFDKQLAVLGKVEELVDVTSYAAKVIDEKNGQRATMSPRVNTVCEKMKQLDPTI